MNVRTKHRRKLHQAFQEIADFCYYLFPKSDAAQVMSSLRHYQRYKGTAFVVNYIKGYRQRLLSADVDSWTDMKFHRTRKVLHRNLLVMLRDPHNNMRLHVFFKFLKTVSLFVAKIDKEAYICEKERLELRPEYNQELFENLVAHIKPFHPIPARAEPYNPLSGNKTWVGYKTKTGSSVSPQELSFSGTFIAQLLGDFPRLFSFLNAATPAMAVALNDSGGLIGRAVLLPKDGALKKRLIFIPHCAVQAAFTPLYVALKTIAKRLPGLYNYNVDAGVQWVSAQHETLYSIDLTSATDWFPVEWQVEILGRLLGPDYDQDLELLLRVSRMEWLTPYGVRITQSVGQPMGLLPSFLAFSISLYFVVRSITPHDNFAILGDDIITTDIEVYLTLRSLGLLISEQKSIVGRNAEWGGTAFLDGTPLYDRRVKHSNDILSVIDHRSWPVAKKKLSRIFSPRDLAKIQFIASLPPPVGCGIKPSVACQLSPRAVEDLYFNAEEIRIEAPKQPPLIHLRMNKIEQLRRHPYVVRQQEAGIPEEEQILPNGKRVIDLIEFFKNDMTGVSTLSFRPAEATTQDEQLLSAYKLPQERDGARRMLNKFGLRVHGLQTYPAQAPENPTGKREFPSWKRLSSYLSDNTNLPIFRKNVKTVRTNKKEAAVAETYTTVIVWDSGNIADDGHLGDFSDKSWPDTIERVSTRAFRGMDPGELSRGRFKVAVKWEGIPGPTGVQVTNVIFHQIVD